MEALQNPRVATELFAIMAISLYGVILSYTLPPKRHFAVNVLCAGTVGLFGYIAGLSLADMGLGFSQLIHALPISIGIAFAIASAISLSVRIPWLRTIFGGSPLAGGTRRQIAYAVGVRIPLSTALLEEVLFRGVLLGLLLVDHSTITAITVSSLIFGVWHIFPTVAQMEHNKALAAMLHKRQRIGMVIGTVITTALAGAAFNLLRIWTGSLFTPWMIHWAINGSATLASTYSAKRQQTINPVDQ